MRDGEAAGPHRVKPRVSKISPNRRFVLVFCERMRDKLTKPRVALNRGLKTVQGTGVGWCHRCEMSESEMIENGQNLDLVFFAFWRDFVCIRSRAAT